MTVTTEAVVRAVAGFGREASLRGVSIDGAWPAVLARLEAERLTGLAVAAVESGALRLEPTAQERLLERHRRAMVRSLALERLLCRLSAAFARGGVDLVVLKGPALAHGFYDDPSWRPFADLDLLVRREEWRAACGLLERYGLRRELPEPRPGFDERFGKAAVFEGIDHLAVDLHRTLVVGPFGLWIDPRALFTHRVRLDVGGSRLWRLDDTALFVHACLHASLGSRPPLLLPVRDVVQVAQRGRVDWERAARWSREWRLGAVICHALQAAGELLGADLPAEAWKLALQPSSRGARRALAAYTTGRRARGGTALSMVPAIPGIRAKAAYVWALVAPSREFLAARGKAEGTYRRRWAVPLRWLRGR